MQPYPTLLKPEWFGHESCPEHCAPSCVLQAYPSLLKPEWFDYESYLWAAELWYSYAFEIEFPPEPAVSGAGAAGAAAAAAASGGGGGGDDSAPASKYVMVPFACHINHSPWPHVVRTRAAGLPAAAPCLWRAITALPMRAGGGGLQPVTPHCIQGPLNTCQLPCRSAMGG